MVRFGGCLEVTKVAQHEHFHDQEMLHVCYTPKQFVEGMIEIL